jgi:alkylation response protein AidB-like acyl-CoA dehydrogenase
MNFQFSPEEERFKEEVRHFFLSEKEVVAGARKEWDSGLGFGSNCWKILGKIGARGWLCPTWPKEYGGLGLSYMYRYIIMEQMHYFLNVYSTVGAGMAGPIILKQGNEKQKKQYLPQIARGEVEFVLGYTEPQAGSDLASLQIRAEDKGDFFLINGSKLFNTRAGDPLIFLTRPISAMLMLAALFLLCYPLVPWLRKKRAVLPKGEAND